MNRRTGPAFLRTGAIGIAAASIVCLLIGARPALAQFATGQFQNGDAWFLGSSGELGYELVGSDQIRVDSNGVIAPSEWTDFAPDTLYDLPPEVQPDLGPAPEYDLEYRLSPSQEHLYVKKFNVNGQICPAPDEVRIYMYALPGPPLMTPFGGAGQGTCVKGPLSIQPTFHDVIGACIRTMAVAVKASGTVQPILWADLVNGVMVLDGATYGNFVTEIKFAPGGNAAFVVHSFSLFPKRYSLIDLCKSRTASVAEMAVTTGDLPGGLITAHAEPDGGGGQQMRIKVNNLDDPMSPPIPLDLSCCAGLPEQACCFTDGTCSPMPAGDCLSMMMTPGGPGTTCGSIQCPAPCCQVTGSCALSTPADCAAAFGTPQGTGMTCGMVTCPALRMSLAMSGPALAALGGRGTYALAYSNTGELTATSARIEVILTSGMQFVSASNGGAIAGSTVTWNLGSLPPGASGEVTLTATMPCYGASVSLDGRITSSEGLSFFSGSVLTTLTTPAPVEISVASVPEDGPPVKGGDLVTHTITLTDASNEPHDSLRIGLTPGDGMAFETVASAGSGQVTVFDPGGLTWDGSLAPLGTTSLVVTARASTCINVKRTRLKGNDASFNGGDVKVVDSCPRDLGRVRADDLPVQRAIELDLAAVDADPPVELESPFELRPMQIVRPGVPIDYEVTINNPRPILLASVSFSVPIPTVLVEADPFLLPPVDPGASYDGASRILSWSGSLASQQTVTIQFRATMAPAPVCRANLAPAASDGTCTVTTKLDVAQVPEPPSEPHLIGGKVGELWALRPGIDTVPQKLFCWTNPGNTGLGQGAGGDIWVTGYIGYSTFRINPSTLELEAFGTDFLSDLGVREMSDVGADTGSVVLSGKHPGSLFTGSIAKVFRYSSSGASLIYSDDPDALYPGFGFLDPLIVDPMGGIVGNTSRGLARLDPDAPPSWEVVGPGSSGGVALDTDGDYIVVRDVLGGVQRLEELNPDPSVAANVIHADLPVLLGTQNPISVAAVDPNGGIILGNDSEGLFRVSRPDLMVDPVLGYPAVDDLVDIEYAYAGANPCNDLDGDGSFAGFGCAPGVQDCNDSDAALYPGAPEVNDGRDNQCPGEAGSGEVDEISGPAVFTDVVTFSWPAQQGATMYEVAISEDPYFQSFSGGCVIVATSDPFWVDPEVPAVVGTFRYYLVRPLSPFPGSWGRGSSGAERFPFCS